MRSAAPLDQEVIDRFVGAAHGDFNTVHDLLKSDRRLVNASASWRETAIEAAAQTAALPIIRLLLEAGAPLEICTAAVLGQIEMVKAILAADPAQINARGAHGIPLLYFPVIVGNLELAGYLVEAGASVNTAPGGYSPLHGAALFNQAGMARWLLAHGADPAAKEYSGRTPVEIAEQSGHNEVVAALAAYESEKY